MVERRQLTALFCDVVNSTALFAQLDAEDVRELLISYHKCCAEQIERFGGFVAQFQGDGVISYFGYTKTSESDAERAVRAALALVDLIPKLATAPGVSLQVRIGVATGLVVVGGSSGEGARPEHGVIGETLHLAVRLQKLAEANQIIVSDTAKRLAGKLFTYQNLGKQAVPGFDRSIQTWRVLGPRRITSQFTAYREQVLSPIVGRDDEIDLLMQTWRRVEAGHGQLITIVGEAGIGKSRLIREFRHRIAKTRHLWLEGGGAQFFGATPFYSAAQLIKRMLDPTGRASSAELQSRLKRTLAQCGIGAEIALPILAELIDLAPDTEAPPAPLSPEEKRATLLATIVDWIRGGAGLQPLVIVLEDLHWLDASSLELCRDVLGGIGALPVLMLFTTRPQVERAWPASPQGVEMRLKPLANAEIRGIVAQLETTGRLLSEQEMSRVAEKAGGVPLFAIELTRLIFEPHVSPGDRRIPESLSDLLMARLDQLGPAKGVAQLASVVGHEIPYSVLEAVSDAPPAALEERLSALTKQGVLQPHAGASERSYAFTHALLRDAAYESLPKSTRRELHRLVALVVSNQSGTSAESRPELIAYHWTNAGEWDVAAAAWRNAGEFATARMAFKEAEQAFQNALDALMHLPPSADRDSRELRMQSQLADVLRITRGLSAPETRHATAHARALAERNGNRAEQLLQSWGAWAAASSGGDFAAGLGLADQFHQLAIADGGAENLAKAHMMQMTSRYRLGDLMGAEEHFLRGEAFFADPAFQRRPDHVAQTYGNAALIIWTLCDDLAAQRRVDHMLATAREQDDPYGLAYADLLAAIHAIFAERYWRAEEFAANCIALCREYGFAQFVAAARAALGRAKTGLGLAEEGAKIIAEGVAGMLAGPVRVGVTMHMNWLAEAHLSAGALKQAIVAAEEALAINPNEVFMRPETLRLRAECRARLGLFAEAEQDFLAALELANQMSAKRFVQRAETGLQNLRRTRPA